jgi:hypothetical protein
MSTPMQLTFSRRSRPLFYVSLTFLLAFIAVAGFWETYFRDLLLGRSHERWLLHVHAAASMGWIGLVGAQAYCATSGRRALHVAVGKWGMAFGVLVFVIGLAFALTRFVERATALGPESVERALVAPLTDMSVFGMFLSAAWLTRRRPESHKRFILLATNTLLIAAVGRASGGTASIAFSDVLPFLLVWLSPLLLAMGYDALRHRRVHVVYLLGFVVLVTLRYRQLLRETDFWPHVTRWLLDVLT